MDKEQASREFVAHMKKSAEATRRVAEAFERAYGEMVAEMNRLKANGGG